MDEIIIAFIFSMLLGLFSLIRFYRICIIVSVITLLIANYTCGLGRAWVKIDTVVLWTILFYMAIMKILKLSQNRIKK